MLNRSLAVIFLMFGLVLCTSSLYALDFKPGLYDVTTQVEMPGMPTAIPPVTSRECMTKEDLIPGNNTTESDCTLKETNQNGNTVTWKMECDQEGQKMLSEGTLTYKGDRFDGIVTVTMHTQSGPMTMKTKISGIRAGNCTGN